MMQELITIIWLGGLFLLLFGLAEWLHHRQHLSAEITRKMVHLGTGLLALLFPKYLTSLWQCGLLCGTFLLLLLFSKRRKFLSSINGIERRSYGSMLYPIAVFFAFAYFQFKALNPHLFTPYFYFAVPVLLLAVCDPIAALSGTYYQRKRNVLATGKTWIGSFAFLVTATFIVSLLALMITTATPLTSVPIAVFIGWITALAERFSRNGWDNLTIPLTAIAGIEVVAQFLNLQLWR